MIPITGAFLGVTLATRAVAPSSDCQMILQRAAGLLAQSTISRFPVERLHEAAALLDASNQQCAGSPAAGLQLELNSRVRDSLARCETPDVVLASSMAERGNFRGAVVLYRFAAEINPYDVATAKAFQSTILRAFGVSKSKLEWDTLLVPMSINVSRGVARLRLRTPFGMSPAETTKCDYLLLGE